MPTDTRERGALLLIKLIKRFYERLNFAPWFCSTTVAIFTENICILSPTSPPPPLTADIIATTNTSPVLESRVVTRLEEPTLLLYPLLAISLVLLVSSLSLALVVFLKGSRSPAGNSRSKECAVQLCQEVSQPGQSSQVNCELTTSSSPWFPGQ